MENNTLIDLDNLNEASQESLNITLYPFHGDQLLFKFNGRTLQKNDKGSVSQLLELDDNNSITNIFKIQDRNFVLTKKGIFMENENQKFDKNNLIFSGINCKKLVDDGENLWITTNKCLNILNKESGKIELINKTDGLPTDDLTDIILTENKV
ncbi:MAG: hypothetical protein AB8H03_18600 [Saprospiraceae bacterium]